MTPNKRVNQGESLYTPQFVSTIGFSGLWVSLPELVVHFCGAADQHGGWDSRKKSDQVCSHRRQSVSLHNDEIELQPVFSEKSKNSDREFQV